MDWDLDKARPTAPQNWQRIGAFSRDLKLTAGFEHDTENENLFQDKRATQNYKKRHTAVELLVSDLLDDRSLLEVQK